MWWERLKTFHAGTQPDGGRGPCSALCFAGLCLWVWVQVKGGQTNCLQMLFGRCMGSSLLS